MPTQMIMNIVLVLAGICWVIYKYSYVVTDRLGKSKIKREEKKIEKTKVNYRNQDEECIDYLAARANELDDSEDRKEVLSMVYELNSKLFEVHYDYDVEETEDV